MRNYQDDERHEKPRRHFNERFFRDEDRQYFDRDRLSHQDHFGYEDQPRFRRESQWRNPFEDRYEGSDMHGSYGRSSYGDQDSFRTQNPYGRSSYSDQDMSRFSNDERYQQQSYGQHPQRSSSSEMSYGRRFRGIGPKGYSRSDERIKEDICDRLVDDDNIDAENISVKVENGEVHLMGTVHDRHTKHLAEECCDAVSGVRDVINELRVKSDNVRSIQRETTSSPISSSTSMGTEEKERAKK